MKNWARNYTYSTANVLYPETLEQIQALVAGTNKLRVIGTRHSFNAIADSETALLSLEHLPPQVSIDADQRTVTVTGNVRYAELCGLLHSEGLALHNLASLPHISVAGAVATATHGSGVRNQNLAAAVASLDLVTAAGQLVHLSRSDSEVFKALVVGLGGFGVVVNLTLDVQPAFDMRQTVYLNLPADQLNAYFHEIMSSAYSVSLFTTWQSANVDQVWVKSRMDDALVSDNFFGATPAAHTLHPIASMSAENCTGQLGARGPWHERLPHFRIDAMPSAGNELQSEYFVAREDALAALRAISSLRESIAPLLLISEIRTIAADDLWMSMAYQRDSVGIHFTWKQDWPAVSQLLPLIENRLAPFDARPHWGKLFTMPPERVQSLYEKQPDFAALMRDYDPQGKFRNAFVEMVVPSDR